MSPLTAIRNPHAVVALVRRQRWGQLAAPVFPADTDAIARATSLLAGDTYRDGRRHPGALSIAQARDVLAWATARIL